MWYTSHKKNRDRVKSIYFVEAKFAIFTVIPRATFYWFTLYWYTWHLLIYSNAHIYHDFIMTLNTFDLCLKFESVWKCFLGSLNVGIEVVERMFLWIVFLIIRNIKKLCIFCSCNQIKQKWVLKTLSVI